MEIFTQFFDQLRLHEKIALFFSTSAFLISIYTLYKNHLEKISILVYPSDFVGLVIQKGTELVPKFNLMCNFINKSTKVGAVHRIEATVSTPDNANCRFAWKLFYQYLPGGEIMTKQADPYPLAISSKASALVGIQFEGMQTSEKFSWSEGRYKIEIYGWTNRKHRRQKINIKSTFHIRISSDQADQLWRWFTADDKEWENLKDPHNAIAVRVPVEEWSDV